MDKKTESIITVLKYILLTVTAAFTAIRTPQSLWGILILSALLACSLTIRNALLYNTEKYSSLSFLSVMLDVMLAYFIGKLDTGFSSEFYYLVIILDITLIYSTLVSSMGTIICFTAFAASNLVEPSRSASFLNQLAYHLLSFLAAYLIVYVAKYEILQRNKLRDTMYELKVKTKQLENTYLKLKSASEDLEEMTILHERTRIAREIHDTVGHTLTTALVELEAGNRLINLNPALAAEKINLAKGQIRRGLSDIRDSVKILQASLDTNGFLPSVRQLIEDTAKHGEIFIKHEIADIPELTPLQAKTLYRALQEGFTNGIRHGGSTAFVVIIKKENNNIRFLLQDNGSGCSKVTKGFGLMSMEERIRELGGILVINTEPGEGFVISITLPLQKEAGNEANTDNNSR